MRTKRFHGLKRIKVRQSWAKANLYNLSRQRPQNTTGRTYYQQKWGAKSIARGFHGEQIREGQWERMFSPTLRSVIPMDHKYLAAYDGAEQAAGRGSGREQHDVERTLTKKMDQIPYMQMTFAPTERRLDAAIFRSLFASSTRQARQFVIHGGVKVNGKKIIYPGYLLNPGDMFQVDPERVMFATGDRKDANQRRATRKFRKSSAKSVEDSETADVVEEIIEDREVAIASQPSEDIGEEIEAPQAEKIKSRKLALKELIDTAKESLIQQKSTLSGKNKQDLRAFTVTVRDTLGKLEKLSDDAISEQLSTLVSKLSLLTPSTSASKSNQEDAPTEEPKLSKEDRMALQAAIIEARDNPYDASKTYATPWRPRPYMSPFAFIPRYLEVNHNICSAVYLRHPVARPGLSEVPTPFTPETSQLAFNWYLRRR